MEGSPPPWGCHPPAARSGVGVSVGARKTQPQHPPLAASGRRCISARPRASCPLRLTRPPSQTPPGPGGTTTTSSSGCLGGSPSHRRPASPPSQCQPPQRYPIWSKDQWQARGSERWHCWENIFFFGRFYFARVRVQQDFCTRTRAKRNRTPSPSRGGVTTSPNVKGGYGVSSERHGGSKATMQPKRPHCMRLTQKRECDRWEPVGIRKE